MDYIERIFGAAPDGGSGSLELVLLVVPLCGTILLALKRLVKRPGAR